MNLEFGHSVKIKTCVELSTDRFMQQHFHPRELSKLIFDSETPSDPVSATDHEVVEFVSKDRLILDYDEIIVDVQITGQSERRTELLILVDIFNECVDPNVIVHNVVNNAQSIA